MADGSVVIDTKLDDKGFKSGLSKLGSIGKTALKGVAVGVGAVATAFAGVVTASVKARGEMEQIEGGAKKIFNEMDFNKIKEDAQNAYKTMNLSASEYLNMINSVGATFASTMGDEKGYNTAKQGMQAIADYASGTGADVGQLNEKFKLITRSTTSYQSIADQFSGILPQTSKDFLAQAQASGYLSKQYKSLTDVPVAEYQQAISQMLEKGVGDMGLLGNTIAETEKTLTGSLAGLTSSWQNFLSGYGDLSTVAKNLGNFIKNVTNIVSEAIPDIIDGITESLPEFIKLGEDLLNNLIDGLLKNLPTLLESAGQIVNSLIQGIIDLLPKIIPVGLQALQMLVQAVLTNLPLIFEAGMKIIPEIIRGITQMLPTLIPQMLECVLTIADAVLDNLDLLIDAGIELIFALIDGIIEALPKLIDKMPEIIEKIVNALIRNAPKILEAGVKLIVKLIEGLIKALPKIAEAIPKIIKTIYKGLIDGVINMSLAGAKLIEGLWKGIKDMRQWIWNQIKGFCSGIVDKVKGFFGIHSPSKVFQNEIGRFLGLGLGKGFKDSLPNVFKNMKSAVDFETQKLSANLSTQATFGRSLNANITLESPDIYMDSTKVGRVVTPYVSKTLRTGGAY